MKVYFCELNIEILESAFGDFHSTAQQFNLTFKDY